jgi:hypothetical protein
VLIDAAFNRFEIVSSTSSFKLQQSSSVFEFRTENKQKEY